MLNNADFRALFLKESKSVPSNDESGSRSLVSGTLQTYRPTSQPNQERLRKHSADFQVQVLAAQVLRSAHHQGVPVRGVSELSQVPKLQRNAVFACATETLKVLRAFRMALSSSDEVNQILHDDLSSMEGEPEERCSGQSNSRERLDASLACVLLHDLLLSGRWLDARQREVQVLLRNQHTLREAFEHHRSSEPDAQDAYFLFARVNTLLTSVESVLATLSAHGWEQLSISLGSTVDLDLLHAFSRAKERSRADHSGRPRVFCRDALFSEMLVFAAGAPVRELALFTQHALILQDRASCACAHVLAPRRGAHIIDACAAPGKKTSHAAALIENTGRISAFEIEPKRAAQLQRFLQESHVSCVSTSSLDFLSVNPTDPQWADVEALMLDPTCSGSGTTFFQQVGSAADFATMQVRLLLHAMRFPGLRTLVYSTCSINEEENEGVVAQALASCNEWRLRDRVLPSWRRRGRPTSGLRPHEAAATLRFCAQTDYCLGFFIACFERVAIQEDVDERMISKPSVDYLLKKSKTKKRRRTEK